MPAEIFISPIRITIACVKSPQELFLPSRGMGSPATMAMARLPMSAQLAAPVAVALDAGGNLYIADARNHRIRKVSSGIISTIAGNGTAGDGGDGGLAINAQLNYPGGVAVDSSSNVYIGDTGNNRIRAVQPPQTQTINFSALSDRIYGAAPFTVSATATSGLTVGFNSQTVSVCAVSGNTVTLVSVGQCTIQATQAGDANWTAATPVNQSFQVTQAGQTIAFGALSNQTLGTAPFSVSASASSGLPVSFASLTASVCTVSGVTVTLVSPGVCTIQAMQAGNLKFAAASPVSQSFQVAPQVLGASSLLVGSAGGSSSVVLTYMGAWTATANVAFLHISPGSANGTNSALVAFTYDAFPGTGTRTGTLTIAGLTFTVTQAGMNYFAPGAVTTLVSGLNTPRGVAVDASGNVYIADTGNNAIKKWRASTQQVTTLVSSGLSGPTGVAVDGSGNVYIADTGNSAIKEWNASTQQVTVLVSSGLNAPRGVAVDIFGNIYIADTGNKAIRGWISATQQLITLVSSGLKQPSAVAVDVLGDVYIADTGNNAIKVWNAATQQVATLALSGLSGPAGVAADGAGNVSIADTGNNAIKQWSVSAQQLTVLVPSGLNGPQGVAVDGSGNIYIADSLNGAIEEFPNAFVGPAGGLTEPASAGSDSLLPVLPSTISLTGTFAPVSDQGWLTIGTIANGVVNFSFTANTSSSARTAHITELGQQITVTQNGVVTGPPAVVSLSPSAGTGLTQTFSMLYSDPAGLSDLNAVAVLFNTSVGASSACFVIYTPGTNQLYLYNDAGTALTGGVTPGSGGQVSNSQCTLAGNGSSLSTSGNNLTLNAALTFTGTFAGPKNVYLYAVGKTSNSGWIQKGTWTPSPPGPPTVVALSPSTGGGLTQTFTTVFSDQKGASDLSAVLVLFNETLKVSGACAVIYSPGTNQLSLYNDAGTGLLAAVVPGSSGQVSNSQCTLAGAGSSFGTSGNNLILNVALTFTGAFVGQKNVFLDAVGKAQTSGWVQKGTWTPSPAGPPTVVSLTPSSGGGVAQTFTAVYSDPNGIADLSAVGVLFNTALSASHACVVIYAPGTNQLYLYNDAGTALSAGVTLGSAASASNSQCTVAGTGSSFSTSGNNLTLKIALTFTGTFVGQQNVFLNAIGKTSASGWAQKGAWIP